MAADKITERFSIIQDELIADVTKAEAMCDVLTARVAELEASLSKFEPSIKRRKRKEAATMEEGGVQEEEEGDVQEK